MPPEQSTTRTIDVHHERSSEAREAVRTFAELIHGIRVAMLTTVDEDGHMRSRPMATMQSELEDELWFFTDARAHKIDDITGTHQVNLTYVDSKGHRYVSVSGIAHMMREQKLLERFWNPAAAVWFPDGPSNDPHLALLRVQLEEAEYWDATAWSMVKLEGFDKAEERQIPTVPVSTQPFEAPTAE